MSEDPAAQLPNRQPDPEVYTVIGAGVIGLLTAHELASQGHNVTVISQDGKPDENANNTSVAAVGQFLPWLPEPHRGSTDSLAMDEVVDHGWAFYERLAQNPHETGVLAVHNVEFVKSDAPWPSDLSAAMKVDEKQLEEPIEFIEPNGTTVGYDTELAFDTFSINTPKTVRYLAGLAEGAGARFETGTITPEMLDDLRGIVINAAGIGAGELAGKVEEVQFYKGQTIIVRPEPEDMPKVALSVEDIIMMPREDGTVVIGALYRHNPSTLIPQEEEATEIVDRITQLFKQVEGEVDGLKADFLERSELIVRRSGYRVEAGVGEIRVVQDDLRSKLLHAYGFAGIGWSVGSYFAKKIAGEARRIHAEQFNGGRNEQ